MFTNFELKDRFIAAPDEVKLQICQYLDINSLRRLAETCHHFCSFIEDSTLWEIPEGSQFSHLRSKRQIYIKLYNTLSPFLKEVTAHPRKLISLTEALFIQTFLSQFKPTALTPFMCENHLHIIDPYQQLLTRELRLTQPDKLLLSNEQIIVLNKKNYLKSLLCEVGLVSLITGRLSFETVNNSANLYILEQEISESSFYRDLNIHVSPDKLVNEAERIRQRNAYLSTIRT